MFDSRELATLLAALLFWREEMTPHGDEIAEPYFAHFGLTAIDLLSDEEIEGLSDRLKTLLRGDSGSDGIRPT